MKKIIRLNESELIGVIKKIINEHTDHIKNLYRSWANKKSGNPEMALSIMDDVLDHQKKLPKKDFAQYSSYEELVNDLNKIKQTTKPEEDVTVLYRGDLNKGDDLIVLAANTHEASCNYGAGSKWCTTAKDDKSYWRRHNEMGTEFFWIFRKKPQDDPNHKFSYHIKLGGNADWCNAINNCKPDIPENSYPKQHPKYNEIIQKLNNFHNSRNFNLKEKNSEIVKNMIHDWVVSNISEIREYVGRVVNIGDIIEDYLDGFIHHIRDYIPYELEFSNRDEIIDWENSLSDEILNTFQGGNLLIKYVDINNLVNLNETEWVIKDLINRNFNMSLDNSVESVRQFLNNNVTKIFQQVSDLHLTEIIWENIQDKIEPTLFKFVEDFNYKYFR